MLLHILPTMKKCGNSLRKTKLPVVELQQDASSVIEIKNITQTRILKEMQACLIDDKCPIRLLHDDTEKHWNVTQSQGKVSVNLDS